MLLLLVGLFCWGLVISEPAKWRILLPTLIFGPLAIIYAAPIIGLTEGPLYHVRYVFTYSPFFYIVVGLAMARLWQKQRLTATFIGLTLMSGAGLSIWQLHTDPTYHSDDLRGAVSFIEARWRPGDAILINAGYAYTAFQYYATNPAQQYTRLTNFNSHTVDVMAEYPSIYETGSVDGPPSLGWGDPASDFYAMTHQETIDALEAISLAHPRVWVLRIYDTVSDPKGVIRNWLMHNMRLFEDQVFTGTANLRVQGYMSRHQPDPPNIVNLMLDDQFILHGFSPPNSTYRAGDQIQTALWLEAVQPSAVPYALSLKLWDDAGNAIAQTDPDEWPVGSQFNTTHWQAGTMIRYPMQLQLPDSLPAGQFWLNVVMYNSQTGQPLTVQPTGDTSVLLGGVEIRPRSQ